MRLGYVDFELDNFHANVYLKAFRGELAGRGFTIAGATSLREATGRAWAAKNDVPYFASVAELAPAVDGFIILAPSNPETHLGLCEQVFPHGKITFVDKTFAPDLATAKQIFALADQQGVAVQTTSALRTTNVQEHIRQLGKPVESLFVSAGGASFAEYGIHPVELVVSCLGPDASHVMRLGGDEHPRLILWFSNDRIAVIDFSPRHELPFTATFVAGGECQSLTVDLDRLFPDAASAMLDFFAAGQPLIDRRESLLVRRILDLADQGTDPPQRVAIDS